jgi:hypothetical protein
LSTRDWCTAVRLGGARFENEVRVAWDALHAEIAAEMRELAESERLDADIRLYRQASRRHAVDYKQQCEYRKWRRKTQPEYREHMRAYRRDRYARESADKRTAVAALRAEALALNAAGFSLREIAKRIGKSVTFVRNAIMRGEA